MATIQETLKTLTKSGQNVAGYIATKGTPKPKKVFRYVVSDNSNLPAAAYVLDMGGMGKKDKIYTNLPPGHWILTYTSRDVKVVTEKTTADAIDSSEPIATPKLSLVAGDRSQGSPLGQGGLFAAAQRLKAGVASKSTGRDLGLERVLRYYMLAAYALLGICADSGYAHGNYIAALMVNDQGQILSFGVNSGYFHHGEVNMLLNYFSKDANKAKSQFEAKTIVFSTLTPCKQCADYLQSCRPPDQAIIYIGQEDTGEFGKEGAKYGTFLDQVTKPPKMYEIQRSKLSKVAVHSHLAAKMKEGEGTVAKQIGQKCKTGLMAAANTLVHKISKDRKPSDDPAKAAEQAVKQDVLNYLGMWLGTVNLSPS